MLKRIILLILTVLLILALLIKQSNMTWRQSILKAIYPIIMYAGKLMGKDKNMAINSNKITPTKSFYDLSAVKNNGDTLHFSELKGKKVLLVNTASDCGYTGQYDALEQLHKQYGGQLVVIGFPANDFKEQEKKSDKEIAEFCKINFGVTFLLMKKSSVIKGSNQDPVFQWLSNPTLNGWNSQQPIWNFCKYIVDENGSLQGYFTQNIAPMDEEVIKLLGY
jgi:glutathione peroxidase